MTRFIVLVLAFTWMVGGVAKPALADGVCDPNDFCVWGGTSQTGDFLDMGSSNPNWPCCGGTGIQNDDDSVWNREDGRAEPYDGGTYSGGLLYCVAPGVSDSNVNDLRDNSGNSSLTYTSAVTSCSGLPLP